MPDEASELRAIHADLADAASQETLPDEKKTWQKLRSEWTDEDQLYNWNWQIDRMGEAYMAWLRVYKGNRRACRPLGEQGPTFVTHGSVWRGLARKR